MTVRRATATLQKSPSVGDFAKFPEQSGSTGVGKVVERTVTTVTVEVFRSPISPEFETLKIAADKVEIFKVPRQTLVYLRRDGQWSTGRTVHEEVQGHFAVKVPNESGPIAIPSRDIFVRSPGVIDDPTDLLAGQVTYSPYFTEARNRLSEFVSSQRSTYRGLTALATARIEYHSHQIGAVRRVLSDPVHRYLLADEVGLGKTIEAGLLISQHLIDEGESGSVLLLAPDTLVDQWKNELAKFFGLEHDSRVRIFPFSALEGATVAQMSAPSPTLTVVDEAHRTADWAFPPLRECGQNARVVNDSRYQALERISRCPKILLLSGTPVLHHEDGFLAMLHLLEPDAYDLADRDGFRRRIAARNVVADVLSELSTDFQADFLGKALERLSSEIDCDEELNRLVATVMSGLAAKPVAAEPAVHELRSYLLERYRLHRRIVRTHRESKPITHLLPKRCGLSFFGPMEDPSRIRAFEALEAWRKRVAEESFDHAGPAPVVFGDLLTHALSYPGQLGCAFERRAVALGEKKALALFEGEEKWLRSVAPEVMCAIDADVRKKAIVEQLLGPLANRRAVIFVDAPEEAVSVVEELRRVAALRQRVLRFAPGESGLLDQYEKCSNAILVCDRNAEEGLNLQRKPATIVFYDFPFDIGRIEQRIGRFDRLEGMRELKFIAATPIGPYENGWTRLLTDQVKIFGRSVARLQYVLAEAMEGLRIDLLVAGAEEAFETITAQFADPKKGLEASLKQLRRQEALDATEWHDDELQAFGEVVSESRATSVDAARDAFEGWLKELNFEIQEDPERGIFYSYVQREKGKNTIIPCVLDCGVQRWLDKDRCIERRTETRLAYGPFVFDPDEESETATLLSVGHPFFDKIIARMTMDDRSRSWGMWRCLPDVASPQVYLCFDFLIEASLARLTPMARSWKTQASLRRRADEIFPVEHRRTWLDLDGESVASPAIKRVLERPYQKEKTVKFAADQNLNHELWALANQHIPVSDWGARVTALRRKLEASVRAEAGLGRKCKTAEAKILQQEQHAVRILRSRAAHAPAREKQAIEAAIGLESELGEALREGVQTPDIVVDNAGVVVLAPWPLE